MEVIEFQMKLTRFEQSGLASSAEEIMEREFKKDYL